MPTESSNPLASQVLKAEHEVILRVLGVLNKLVDRYNAGQGFEAAAFGKCVEFFRLFADACHHGKEEDLLFPKLEARGIPRNGGPIGVMLHEHMLGRQIVKRMAAALEAPKSDKEAPAKCVQAAREFMGLLSQHIYKEDNILFVMGDRAMNDADQAELGASFCHVQCQKFQGKTREQLQALAGELVRQWA
mgnify:CR=1 FL=1